MGHTKLKRFSVKDRPTQKLHGRNMMYDGVTDNTVCYAVPTVKRQLLRKPAGPYLMATETMRPTRRR
jgi:hypothetical protein